MIHEFFQEKRPHRGMTPFEYRRHLEEEAVRARQRAASELDEHQKYLPLNLQRTKRIERTYAVAGELEAAVRSLSTAQLWMVLTEPWCGDSAQNLPYIVKVAACSPAVDLRVLLRDQNTDIMDRYLTNGSRSIPKLVAFDLHGNELFQWGPRPVPAAELFRRMKAECAPVEEIKLKLHLWYGRDHGKALEVEFQNLLGHPARLLWSLEFH